MNAAGTLGLCQPAGAILLVSVAGVLYHILAGRMYGIIWWIMVGLFGTGVFQALCHGGMEPVAWILMSVPVLIVCFFLAVALFASRMRIQNVERVPCDRCGRPKRGCGCQKPRCMRPGPCGCPACSQEGFAGNRCPYGPCDCPRCGGSGPMCPYCPGAVEGFQGFQGGDAGCDCQGCNCIGGVAGGCGKVCKRQGCLDCGGSGCPYCAYANDVVTGTQFFQAAGIDPADDEY